jgi:hypothetical protein
MIDQLECALGRIADLEFDNRALRRKLTQANQMLNELRTARPLLLYGDAWLDKINQTLAHTE